MPFVIRERGSPHSMIRSPYRSYDLLNDGCNLPLTSPCSRSLLTSRVALRVQHPYKKRAWNNRINCEIKNHKGWRRWNLANQKRTFAVRKHQLHSLCKDKKLTWFWFTPTPVASIIVFVFCVSIFAFTSAHQHRRTCYILGISANNH